MVHSGIDDALSFKSSSACLYAVLSACLSTLKALAKALHATPESLKDLTSAASAAPSFRNPRIFLSLSLLLSDAVPRNKWSGFVQTGLSHLWQTCIPCGMLPKCNIQDTRLAADFSCMPPSRIIPYPNRCLAPDQSQQPSFLMTFSQNLSANGRDFLMCQTHNVAMTTL